MVIGQEAGSEHSNGHLYDTSCFMMSLCDARNRASPRAILSRWWWGITAPKRRQRRRALRRDRASPRLVVKATWWHTSSSSYIADMQNTWFRYTHVTSGLAALISAMATSVRRRAAGHWYDFMDWASEAGWRSRTGIRCRNTLLCRYIATTTVGVSISIVRPYIYERRSCFTTTRRVGDALFEWAFRSTPR